MSRGRKSKKDNLLTALKQAILQQAIQGNLTADWRAENPDIEPASELLKRIKAEKQTLIDEKKIRKEKPLPAISAKEIPFDLPDGWVWCRLGEITFYGTSQKVESSDIDLDTWVLDLEDIEKESSKIIQYKTFKERPSLSTKSKFQAGWVLYSKLRPYLDKVVVVEKNGVCTTEILPLPVFGGMIPKFMMYDMKSKEFLAYVNSKVSGMKMPRLKTDDGRNALISLAPLPEQTAIVQKVEALMQKCDALEKGKSIQHYPAINELADQLLNRYAVGRQLLAELPQKQTQVKQLKQAILQEAIQGKLTADWRAENPDAEPASELLKRIKAEKQTLIDEKKIRKEKPLPAISAEEIPFDLPDGWVWCRLGEIYQSTSGGTPSRGNSEYWSGDIYWYKSGELNDGVLEQQPKELITNKGLKESSATLFPVGTLLIAMYGATAGKLSILNVEATTNQAVCGFYNNKHISTQYLFNYLLGNRKKMIDESWGMSQPNISQTYLRNFIFALPPLSEQTAIVQKVEALMQTCTDLETQIKQSEAHATQLMQAVIKEAFADEKARATP